MEKRGQIIILLIAFILFTSISFVSAQEETGNIFDTIIDFFRDLFNLQEEVRLAPAPNTVDRLDSGSNVLETYTIAPQIQDCVDDVQPGETCLVGDGTYNEAPLSVVGKNGAAGNRIIIKSSIELGAEIIGGIDLTLSDYVTIDGFKIKDGYDPPGQFVYPYGVFIEQSDFATIINNYIYDVKGNGIEWATTTSRPTNNYIAYNKIVNSLKGMNIFADNTIIEFNEVNRLNKFQDGSLSDADYTRTFGINLIIRNNLFHNTTLYDISWKTLDGGGQIVDCVFGVTDCKAVTGATESQCYDFDPYCRSWAHVDGFQMFNFNAHNVAKNITIENNLIEGYHQGIIIGNNLTFTDRIINNITIRNNIFKRPFGKSSKIIYGDDFRDVYIYNNVFDATEAIPGAVVQGLHMRNSEEPLQISGAFQNNIVYNMGKAITYKNGNTRPPLFYEDSNIIYNTPIGDGNSGSNFVGVDPLFLDDTDPLGADDIAYTIDDGYRVLTGSPAIDAGNSSVNAPKDMFGTPRPQGSGYDIGVYEYVSGGGATCGNAIVEFPEECEFPDTQGCIDGQGYSGSQSCIVSTQPGECTFDTCISTESCGEGTKNGLEDCDGSDFGTSTCTNIPGGFTGGFLGCTGSCVFDTSLCTISPPAVCGNDVAEGSEVCDGTDLRGEDCGSQGFTGGPLACSGDCLSFDTSLCTAPAVFTEAYYAFDDVISDGFATDSSIFVNHGSCDFIGGTCPAFVVSGGGDGSNAYNFDGVNDAIDLGDNYDFAGQDFSVCVWAKPTTTNNGYIIGKFSGSSGFYLRRESTNDWSSDTASGSRLRMVGGVDLDQWQHICAVISPTGISYLYKNAVEVDSDGTVAGTPDNSASMVIGNRDDGARAYQGLIDDVRIYDIPLTQPEIQALYDNYLCGNGNIDGSEVCDDGVLNGQPGQCNLACDGIVPLVCDLTSASWSTSTATENDIVNLNVVGSDCGGETFNYTIMENDGLLPDDLVDSFISSSLNPSWTVIYQDDGFGNPEYYFDVFVVSNPGETKQSIAPDLDVEQAPITITYTNLLPADSAVVSSPVTFSSTVDSDSSNIIDVSLYGDWSGSMQLISTQTFSSLSYGSEMLLNPGFDGGFTSGLADNWLIQQDASSVYTASEDIAGRTGSAQKIDVTSLGSWGLMFYQAPPLDLGKDYLWSLWYKTEPGVSISAALSNAGNTQINQVNGADFVSLPDTNNVWQQVDITFTHTNVLATRLRIDDNGVGAFWLDDFSLKEVTGSPGAPSVNPSFVEVVPSGVYDWYLETTDEFSNVQTSVTRSIDVQAAGSPIPEIFNISAISDVVLLSGPPGPGTTAIVGRVASETTAITGATFLMEVRDNNGIVNLDSTTAQVSFSRGGEVTRSASCTRVPGQAFDGAGGVGYANYTCNVNMEWYDGFGPWTVTTDISDVDLNVGTSTYTDGLTFTVLPNTGIRMVPNTLEFGILAPGSKNNLATSGPLTLSNIGNTNPVTLKVLARQLVGQSDGTKQIDVNVFGVGLDTGFECVFTDGNTIQMDGTAMDIKALTTDIPGFVLDKGDYDVDGSLKEEFFVCLTSVDPLLPPQAYSALGASSWEISIS